MHVVTNSTRIYRDKFVFNSLSLCPREHKRFPQEARDWRVRLQRVDCDGQPSASEGDATR